MVINATSTIFQLHLGSQFHWWRKTAYTEKTTDLQQVTDKLYRTILYQVYRTMSGGIPTHFSGNRH